MPNEDISNRLKGLHFFKGMSSDELGILSEHVEMEELEPESVVPQRGRRRRFPLLYKRRFA